jgi:hypothetical protein
MAAAKYNLTIEQGATFIKQITLSDATTGVARDLTGWTGRGMIRLTYDDAAPYAVFNVITDGITGVLSINLTSVQTAAFEFESALYDVELVQDGTTPEYVERILQGNVFLSKEVTK